MAGWAVGQHSLGELARALMDIWLKGCSVEVVLFPGRLVLDGSGVGCGWSLCFECCVGYEDRAMDV